jgi:hypothetical protein
MKLYKDGMVKELTSEKVVNRWLKFGWTADETPVAPDAPSEEAHKPRRRRPARVADGNA